MPQTSHEMYALEDKHPNEKGERKYCWVSRRCPQLFATKKEAQEAIADSTERVSKVKVIVEWPDA